MTADGKLNINQNRQGGQEVREAEGGGHAPKHVARGKVEGLRHLGPGTSSHSDLSAKMLTQDLWEAPPLMQKFLAGNSQHHHLQAPGAAPRADCQGGKAETGGSCPSSPGPRWGRGRDLQLAWHKG